MKEHRVPRVFVCVLFALVFAVSLSGCNQQAIQQLAAKALATMTAAAENEDGDPGATPEATAGAKSTSGSKATAVPKATTSGKATTAKATAAPKATTAKATKTPRPQKTSLNLVDQGFGQVDQQVGFAFLVENPSTDAVLGGISYQVVAYDKDDKIVSTTDGDITVIMPGQTLGIGGSMYLDEGFIIDHIEVTLSSGDVIETKYSSAIEANGVTFIQDEYSLNMQGAVYNPFAEEIQYVRVFGVAYDADGNIIGGGDNYLSFIPSEVQVGSQLYVIAGAEVDRVEMYAMLNNLEPYDDSEERIGAEEVELVTFGFGGKEGDYAYAAIFRNNSNKAAEQIEIYVTFYNDNNEVVGVASGWLSLVLPGEEQASVGEVYLDESIFASTAEIIYRIDYMTPVEGELPSLTTDNLNFMDDEWSPTVTGKVFNPYDFEVDDIQVMVVAYNANDEVIGSGSGYLDFIPAGSSSAVEVYVTVLEAPARLEMYASTGSLEMLIQ